jgi:succinate dehydrogenase / fumarate reductase flavoprotein subunit
MADYETFEHDVLDHRCWWCGLARGDRSLAAGVSVGLVCKSLLGKAHTVMAEGGIAAALPTSMIATIGKCISQTRCAAVST